MTDEVTIRTATLDDRSRICELLHELDDHHVRIRPDIFQSFSGPVRPRERLARLIDGHDGEIFLAEVGSDVVGLATIQLTEGPDAPMFRPFHRALIDDLIVTQEFQGMGIGKKLLDRAVEWTRLQGVPSININVWIDNEAGASFYTDNGFTPLCQRMELRV